MQSCLRICFWPGDSTAWCPASLNSSLASSVFSLHCLELNITRHGEQCTSYSECGVRWSVPHPMGLKVWRLERVTASSPSWGVAVCRSCLWGIWTFKTLSRVNLSSVVDWQSHVPSTHSVPWLFGVPEDCFLGRKNYKVGQSCWLCPSRLVGATLWSLSQGSIWFGAVGGGISPERKCFLLWADGFTDY